MRNILIEEELIRKYNIRKGMVSPFTGYRIVDEKGEYTYEPSQQENSRGMMPQGWLKDDGIDHLDNGFEFSTWRVLICMEQIRLKENMGMKYLISSYNSFNNYNCYLSTL